MGKLTEILRKAGNILFPPALFREWPFMLIFCMMSAPYYRPERDIASESYRPVRRLTTEGFYIDPE